MAKNEKASSFIFLQHNLPWLQYTVYIFLKAVVNNQWRHPEELHCIWQLHPSSCPWCPVIIIIWGHFSFEETGKSGLASGQVNKEGGWFPPDCDPARSALLSWQNDQGHFCAKETICLLHKIMASHFKSLSVAFLAPVHEIHSPKILCVSHPVYQNSDQHHLHLQLLQVKQCGS